MTLHRCRFIAKVFLNNKFVCENTGRSKKLAKLNAVTDAVQKMDLEAKVVKNSATYKPLYNTDYYNRVLDTTWFKGGSKNV